MTQTVMPTSGSARRSKVRWIVATLMWLAIAINYVDRTVLSAAAPHLIRDLNIPIEMMGIVLSAFFWLYALLQIPAGWFCDKFGQKIGLGISIMRSSTGMARIAFATGAASVDPAIGCEIGEPGDCMPPKPCTVRAR